MKNEKIHQSFQNITNAMLRLEEGIARDPSDQLMIDGIIQRFEFVFELSWKLMKRLFAFEEMHLNSPREILKQAYQSGWIQNEAAWLQMLRDRNQTSHVYNEHAAREVYQNIRQNYPALKETIDLLREKYQELI